MACIVACSHQLCSCIDVPGDPSPVSFYRYNNVNSHPLNNTHHMPQLAQQVHCLAIFFQVLRINITLERVMSL